MADHSSRAAELVEIGGLAYSAKTLQNLQDEVAKTILLAARDAHDAGMADAYNVARAISIQVEQLISGTAMMLVVEAHARKQALDRGVAA